MNLDRKWWTAPGAKSIQWDRQQSRFEGGGYCTSPDSVDFTVVSPWFTGDVRVNIPGKFSVYNALAAIGTCALMGVPLNISKKGWKR